MKEPGYREYRERLKIELDQLEAVIETWIGDRNTILYWKANGQRNSILTALMLDERLAAIEALLEPTVVPLRPSSLWRDS